MNQRYPTTASHTVSENGTLHAVGVVASRNQPDYRSVSLSLTHTLTYTASCIVLLLIALCGIAHTSACNSHEDSSRYRCRQTKKAFVPLPALGGHEHNANDDPTGRTGGRCQSTHAIAVGGQVVHSQGPDSSRTEGQETTSP